MASDLIRGSGIFGLFDINFDDIIARFRREPAVIQLLAGDFISFFIIKFLIDDIISIDIPGLKLELKVSDEELAARKAKWQPREPKVTTGYLKRYASLVT